MAPHPLARLEFAGCRVPEDALIGVAGEGFRLAMRTLDIFRASVAAAALGFARRAADEALGHARERSMFGGTLSDFQLAQAKLAGMATAIDASALLTYRAAWLRDVKGGSTTKEAAMAKWMATESAQQVIDDAVQLFGALGVTRGQTVERLYREIRALRIYEGATDVQKLIVARELLRIESAEAMSYSAHVDTFARDNLPPREQWPELLFVLPELQYPERMNCATMLLDGALGRGLGGRLAVAAPDGTRWTFADLLAHANRIARVLVEDSRARSRQSRAAARAEQPMHAACWFAVLKAGGIAVGTMPLLRAKELTDIVVKARISHALCDYRLAAELEAALPDCPTLRTVAMFGTDVSGGLDALAAGKSCDVRQRRHGVRRHGAHRVHLGYDRHAERDDALPP